MGSASSPMERSLARAPNADRTNRFAILIIGLCALAGVLVLQQLPPNPMMILDVSFLMAAALTIAWVLHLRASGLGRKWCASMALPMLAVLTALLQHVAAPGWTHWWSSLGCGVFVYVMLWVLGVHERESGLQPSATAALALSIGVVARPPVILGCILLSFVIFLEERGNERGILSLFLLLFTPAFLYALLLGFLDHVWGGGLVRRVWDIGYSGEAVPAATTIRYEGIVLRSSATLGLIASVLAARVWDRQVGKTDLGFVFLFLFLVVLGTLKSLPGRLLIDDLRLVLTLGGCSLLAMKPPAQLLSRAMVIGVALLTCVIDGLK